MLRIYYDYFSRALEMKLNKHTSNFEKFKNSKETLESEIINFYTKAKVNKEQFLFALKDAELTKEMFNSEQDYNLLKLKIEDLKIVKQEHDKASVKTNLAKKINVSYEIFKFIVDEFLIALRDEFIKGNYCVIRLPYVGVFVMTLKYPRARINKKTGNVTYPVSWKRSYEYKAELEAKGIKTRKAGETEGENWLLPMKDPYPIVVWLKSQATQEYYNILSNVIYNPNFSFIKDLYSYIGNVPEVVRKYETVGNHYMNKMKEWTQQRRSARNQ